MCADFTFKAYTAVCCSAAVTAFCQIMIELCFVCLASGHVHDDRLIVLIMQSVQLIISNVTVYAGLLVIATGHHARYGKVNVR